MVVPYPNTSAYGHKYERSTSFHKLSRLGRCAAFRPNRVNPDIENCQPNLLTRVLLREHTSDGPNPSDVCAMYPTLCLYKANYIEWRVTTSKGSNGAINAIFGVGRCDWGGVPFHHAWRRDVQSADAYLCTHRSYTHLQRHYSHRERPLFGQNDAILSSEEDQCMGHILNLVKRPPLFLMYDGDIYEARNIDDEVRISNECTSAAWAFRIGI